MARRPVEQPPSYATPREVAYQTVTTSMIVAADSNAAVCLALRSAIGQDVSPWHPFPKAWSRSWLWNGQSHLTDAAKRSLQRRSRTGSPVRHDDKLSVVASTRNEVCNGDWQTDQLGELGQRAEVKPTLKENFNLEAVSAATVVGTVHFFVGPIVASGETEGIRPRRMATTLHICMAL